MKKRNAVSSLQTGAGTFSSRMKIRDCNMKILHKHTEIHINPEIFSEKSTFNPKKS